MFFIYLIFSFTTLNKLLIILFYDLIFLLICFFIAFEVTLEKVIGKSLQKLLCVWLKRSKNLLFEMTVRAPLFALSKRFEAIRFNYTGFIWRDSVIKWSISHLLKHVSVNHASQFWLKQAC